MPELAIRGTNNNDYHYPFRTMVNRARLTAANGDADNHVYWIRPITGLSTLKAMDHWLAAIEADTRSLPKHQKVVANKPAELVSGVRHRRRDGHRPGGLRRRQYPYFREPRTVAGDAWTIYTMKCQLKPLDRERLRSVTSLPSSGRRCRRRSRPASATSRGPASASSRTFRG